MKRKKCLAALTAAGVISAMALGMAVTSVCGRRLDQDKRSLDLY